MVNKLEFTDRLKKILEHHQLTASLFADKIAVQRSSISHILSGRNNPSLDFILKITNTFTDVDIHWLLNGKGVFPKIDAQRKTNTTTLPFMEHASEITAGKKIQRVVIFYSDGTFEEYKK